LESLKKGFGKGGYEPGYRYVLHVRFAHPSHGEAEVMVDYLTIDNVTEQIAYAQLADSTWRASAGAFPSKQGMRDMTVNVRQGLNDPPQLIATDTGTKHRSVILDPNPELHDLDLETHQFTDGWMLAAVLGVVGCTSPRTSAMAVGIHWSYRHMAFSRTNSFRVEYSPPLLQHARSPRANGRATD